MGCPGSITGRGLSALHSERNGPPETKTHLHELIDKLISGLRVFKKCQGVWAPSNTFWSCHGQREIIKLRIGERVDPQV